MGAGRQVGRQRTRHAGMQGGREVGRQAGSQPSWAESVCRGLSRKHAGRAEPLKGGTGGEAWVTGFDLRPLHFSSPFFIVLDKKSLCLYPRAMIPDASYIFNGYKLCDLPHRCPHSLPVYAYPEPLGQVPSAHGLWPLPSIIYLIIISACIKSQHTGQAGELSHGEKYIQT